MCTTNKIRRAIGFALVYYVGVNERENLISGMEMFQSNIYGYARIESVCAGAPTKQTMMI